MRTSLRFCIPLASLLVILLTLMPLVAMPAYASGSAKKPPRRSLLTSSSVINDVPLIPGWWNGDQCDSTHYDNSPSNPGHLQAMPLANPAPNYRGEVACGPMPLQSGVDVPVNFYTGAPTENEWECTELVKRYLYQAFGAPDIGLTNGYQIVDNYQNALLKKYPNNGTPNIYPVAGDVLSFAQVNNNGGHTAIVTGSTITDPINGIGTVTILEQNNTNDPNGTGTLQIGAPNNAPWVVGSEPGLGAVTGWLHPNTLVPIQTPTPTLPPGRYGMQPPPAPPGTVSDPLTAVSSDAPNDAWAVGEFQTPSTGHFDTLIEHWNGKAWLLTPSPSPGAGDNYLTGVKAFSPNNVWAIGYSYSNATGAQTIIEHSMNGGVTWNATTQGAGWLYAIDGASPDDIWAVGMGPAGSANGLTLHFANNTWTSVVNGTSAGTTLLGVSAGTATDVWAVGNNGSQALSMHWDGTSWTIEMTPNPGQSSNRLLSVTDIAANDVWAVGISDSRPDEAGFAIHWNGTSWDTPILFNAGIGSGLGGVAAISSSAFSTPHLWAVGYVYDGTSLSGLIEESSDGGQTWQQVSNPTFATGLSALAINQQNGSVWILANNTGPTLQQGATEFFN